MRLTLVLSALAALAIATLCSVGPLLAHSAHSGQEYSAYCCNGDNMTGDCQPISDKTVKATPQGYLVTLKPGDHRLVTKEHTFTIPYADAKEATDGGYHLCLYPTEDYMRCFYAPPMGS